MTRRRHVKFNRHCKADLLELENRLEDATGKRTAGANVDQVDRFCEGSTSIGEGNAALTI